MAITGVTLPELELDVNYFGARRFERARHYHPPLSPSWILHWHQTSTATVTKDGRLWRLGPEQVTLVAPRTQTYQTLEQDEAQTYVHFILSGRSPTIEDRLFIIPVDDVMRSLLEATTATFRRKQRVGDAESFRVYALVCHVLYKANLRDWPQGAMDPRVREALRTMDQRFRERIRNPDLARTAGMATNPFARLFRQQVGVPPGKYLLDARLANAATMLAHTQISVDKIAERCGFCDRNHFSTVFRKAYGMGPASYRKRVLA